MHFPQLPPQLVLLLPLLSFLIIHLKTPLATAAAVPYYTSDIDNDNDIVDTRNLPSPRPFANPFSHSSPLPVSLPPPPPPPPLLSQPQLHPRAFPPKGYARVAGLPPGWTGAFTLLESTRPSLPLAQIFVRFFRTAVTIAANDPVASRWVQRIEYGVLVLEMAAVDAYGHGKGTPQVSREFMHAATLWLLDRAVKGWTELFEAFVVDQVDGECVFLKLGTVWDFEGGPKVKADSPWD